VGVPVSSGAPHSRLRRGSSGSLFACSRVLPRHWLPGGPGREGGPDVDARGVGPWPGCPFGVTPGRRDLGCPGLPPWLPSCWCIWRSVAAAAALAV